MPQTFFHVVFVSTFVAIVAIRGYYFRRARKASGEVTYDPDDWQPRLRRIFGIPFVILLVAFATRPSLLNFAELSLPVSAQWMGVILGLLAVLLMFWVQEALGENFDVRLHVREEHTLVTHGPYRWVRHPMYTTVFIWGTSILLLTRNWLTGGLVLLFPLIIVATRVAKEEAAMLETFGDEYERYLAHTGRFLPRLRFRR